MSSRNLEHERIVIDSEGYYEARASQEEIYLESIEERARARFLAVDRLASRECKEELHLEVVAAAAEELRTPENTGDPANHASEQTIAGDSDRASVAVRSIVEMIRRGARF